MSDTPPVSPIQLINELKATRLSYTRLQTKADEARTRQGVTGSGSELSGRGK